MATDKNTYRGRVVEELPNLQYKIETESGAFVRCYLAGKMRINKIKVILGDRVEYVLAPDGRFGRIVRRH